MRRSTEIILAVFASAFVAFAIGSCGNDGIETERDELRKQAFRYRAERDSLRTAQGKTDTVTRRVIIADRAVLAQRDSLMSVLTYADSVLADSAASLVTLRVTLAEQVRQTRAYMVRTDSLQGQVRDLIAAHAEERFRTNQTLAAADSTITAWQDVAHAETRKGWRRFTQGVLLGGVVALFGVLVL